LVNTMKQNVNVKKIITEFLVKNASIMNVNTIRIATPPCFAMVHMSSVSLALIPAWSIRVEGMLFAL